jgi:hypothetical protein
MANDERLKRLERELVWAKRCIYVLSAGVVMILLAGLAVWAAFKGVPGVPRVVRANRFVVEDDQGKARAVLGWDSTGTQLTLLDSKGGTRLAISLVKDLPSLTIYDPEGDPGALLWTTQEGSELHLAHTNGASRAVLGATPNGVGLRMDDAEGSPLAVMAVESGEPKLRFYGVKGEILWEAR